MFGLMLFLHFTGLFLWLGALLAAAVTLSAISRQRQQEAGGLQALGARLIRIFQRLGHSGAVAVLGSGVYMIIQMDLGKDKPLWLEVMEKGGGTLILLALVVLGIMGSRLTKKLAQEASVGQTGAAQQAGQARAVQVSRYIAVLSVFMALIVTVILVVSIKI
ncbi:MULTISPECIES: hypothetical protein [unclassified Paenibacillus]|uniref:hypothetical protein n=1 Tax=unclassified Paenibacillus TaxID=185978 RepID=UPI000931C647|nr:MULTISPECIES: hypothetical protein [unclassified Paenibacillus]